MSLCLFSSIHAGIGNFLQRNTRALFLRFLRKTTIIALNLLLPIPYLARRGFFSPRKKRYQKATKNIPFPHYSPPCRLHYSSFSFQKKAISRKSRDEKRRIKMHPYHLVAPSFFQTFFFPLRETAVVAWSGSATKS